MRTKQEINECPVSYTLGGERGADFTIHVGERNFSMGVDEAKALFRLMFTGGICLYSDTGQNGETFPDVGAKALYASIVARARADIKAKLVWLMDESRD